MHSAEYRGKLFEGVITNKKVVDNTTFFSIDYTDGGSEELVQLQHIRVLGLGLPSDLC
jgi:hypothetical protein